MCRADTGRRDLELRDSLHPLVSLSPLSRARIHRASEIDSRHFTAAGHDVAATGRRHHDQPSHHGTHDRTEVQNVRHPWGVQGQQQDGQRP